jgi:hypothetical protein
MLADCQSGHVLRPCGSDKPERLRKTAGPGIAVSGQNPARRQPVEGVEGREGRHCPPGSMVKGPSAGPTIPVVTARVVIASPMKIDPPMAGGTRQSPAYGRGAG